MDTHTATKTANEPSGVATPISIPFICRTATTQDAAASPSVAVSAAAVAAVLALVTAAEREAGAASARYRTGPPAARQYPNPGSLRPDPAFTFSPSLCLRRDRLRLGRAPHSGARAP